MGGFMFPGLGLIVFILLIFGIVWLLAGGRFGSNKGGYSMDQRDGLETPLEILKRRYARGEITKEEYDRMRKDL
jgi:putative membrane protein